MITEKQPFAVARLILPVVALTVCSPPAKAADGAYMTGRTLALLCSSTKAEDAFSCQSYIAGIIDYHRLIKSLGTAPGVDFCVPDSVKMAQLKTLVTTYIRRHTEHQDFIASPAVALALFDAYPCRSAMPKKKRHWR